MDQRYIMPRFSESTYDGAQRREIHPKFWDRKQFQNSLFHFELLTKRQAEPSGSLCVCNIELRTYSTRKETDNFFVSILEAPSRIPLSLNCLFSLAEIPGACCFFSLNSDSHLPLVPLLRRNLVRSTPSDLLWSCLLVNSTIVITKVDVIAFEIPLIFHRTRSLWARSALGYTTKCFFILVQWRGAELDSRRALVAGVSRDYGRTIVRNAPKSIRDELRLRLLLEII